MFHVGKCGPVQVGLPSRWHEAIAIVLCGESDVVQPAVVLEGNICSPERVERGRGRNKHMSDR